MILRNLVKKAKNSDVFILLGIVLFLFTSTITISQWIKMIRNDYNNTIGYKQNSLNIINQLSADTNILYFQSLLGNPVFINTINDSNSEYIFVNKYYYVQAIVDPTKKILAYSVTTRTKDFNPTLILPSTHSNEVDTRIVLGKTKFSDIGNLDISSDINIVSYLGAHDYYYGEEYYWGNPRNYQTYFFSLNESGYNNEIFPPYEESNNKNIKSDPKIIEFRKNAIINTYTVTSPFITSKDFGPKDVGDFTFGPDYNQVRVLGI